MFFETLDKKVIKNYMKATELMLGDIVLDAADGTIKAVQEVKDNEDYRPVPILSRTLKQMGFVQSSEEQDGKERFYYTFSLSIRPARDNITYCSYKDDETNFCITIKGKRVLTAKVVYLHEMQHFLTVYGLSQVSEQYWIDTQKSPTPNRRRAQQK